MVTIIAALHEKWWEKMKAGEKLLEIRKTRPKEPGPFRVLVYITGTGCIYGQFTCPIVLEVKNYEDIVEKSRVPLDKLHEYGAGKPLAGWVVHDVVEYVTPHPLSLYGLTRPPQSWRYYKGDEVPDLMTINNLAGMCGYFFNAEFAEPPVYGVNNGYNCNHPEQQEKCVVGCCYQWSCPLQNVCLADEEDCEKYGIDFEENEFVLVYGGLEDGTDKD